MSAPRRSGLVAALVIAAALIGRLLLSQHNAVLPGIPKAPAPHYAPCSDAELIKSVSLVVTVKDTCGQAQELLKFVNTGIWNYVRYVTLAEVVLVGSTLPQDWKDQAVFFYSWFESVGFNRYNGQHLPQFIEEPAAGSVNVSRTMETELPTEVLPHRVPPKSAVELLPWQQCKKAAAIDISSKEPHLPISVRTSRCDASDDSSYRMCGLVVQDGDACICYSYVVPFNLRTTFYLDKLMTWMKLPSRAFMYGQMKYWSVPTSKDQADMRCERTQEDCSFEVRFSKNARVLQWSWFGRQPKYLFTAKGMLVAVVLVVLVMVPMFASSKRAQEWLGIKKQQLRSLRALNAIISHHVIRY